MRYSLMLDRTGADSFKCPIKLCMKKQSKTYSTWSCSANSLIWLCSDSQKTAVCKVHSHPFLSVHTSQFHIKTYSDSLQQKYSNHDTISNHNNLQHYRKRGDIKRNCTVKAQLYKLTCVPFASLLSHHVNWRGKVWGFFGSRSTLSATGQRAQRGVAVQTAVCFRGHSGVTAGISGLRRHGWNIVGWRGGGRGGCGLMRAVDHCCTCAAKNTSKVHMKRISTECIQNYT